MATDPGLGRRRAARRVIQQPRHAMKTPRPEWQMSRPAIRPLGCCECTGAPRPHKLPTLLKSTGLQARRRRRAARRAGSQTGTQPRQR
eukprot:821962-Alexandrium_andersonii.AAC.1